MPADVWALAVCGHFPLPFFAHPPYDTASRMLKKSASFVLASPRGSTYRSVRLASSLAAAAPDGPFEHPTVISPPSPCMTSQRCLL
jgi:hypothetical protein